MTSNVWIKYTYTYIYIHSTGTGNTISLPKRQFLENQSQPGPFWSTFLYLCMYNFLTSNLTSDFAVVLSMMITCKGYIHDWLARDHIPCCTFEWRRTSLNMDGVIIYCSCNGFRLWLCLCDYKVSRILIQKCHSLGKPISIG